MDRLVEHLASDPGRAALCLDFDGTLTPIVADPTTSALSSEVAALLGELVGSLGAVAVVSGRPAAFLGERVTVDGVRRLGLYGLEEWVDGAAVAREEAARWQRQVDRARGVLQGVFGGVEGIRIEDKGLSVAVHWRGAVDRTAAEEAITDAVERLAADSGLRPEPGKLVAELRPPVDWDKGSAVRVVAEDAGGGPVAYLGDDLGDLPAFEAARALGGLAVAVDHGEETPPALREAADLVLDGPDAVVAALRALRDRLR
jgi:trehalose 6-phosphate phosphatase